MLEGIVLGLFAAAILSCALTGHTVIWALIAGFFLFSGYGLFRGHGLKALGAMASKGVRTIMGIVIVMALIGMLTGSWRASGTIARLVTDAAGFITPEWGLLAAFLLNGLLPTLAATAFGTVATMGVITATMLDAMGVSPLLSGGAILAGVFMGDRCSPVSTSAALVAVVTKTNLYTNLKLMVKTSVVPLLAAGAVYAAIGLLNPGRDAGIDVTGIFRSAFSLHWTTYLPAVVLLALIFLKFSIRLTMVASTLAAVLLCAFVQDMPWRTIGETLVLGFAPEDPGVAKMLAGGGLVSMLPVCAIILISSTYSGLLEGTGLIARLKGLLPGVARRLTPFGAVLTTAVVTCGIACNQALPVMLTNQLCDEVRPDRQKMAIDLENTVIVIAPLIPWSIAGAVPIASVGAPAACVLAAFYLWFLPLWQWILAFVERARQTRGA